MFCLTIRELLLITICAALGVSWWQASHVSRVAASDALELADYAANARFGRCSDPERLGALLKKYGATVSLCSTPVTPRIIIVEEEEEKLGIDFEE